MCCGKNGVIDRSNNAVAYAWFIWEKGFHGDPIIKWIDYLNNKKVVEKKKI